MLELIDMLANTTGQREPHLLSPTLNPMTKPLQQRKTGTTATRKRKAKKCVEPELQIPLQDINPVLANYGPHNAYNATYISPASYSIHNTYTTTSSNHHHTMPYGNTSSAVHQIMSNEGLSFYHEPAPPTDQFQRRLNDHATAVSTISIFLYSFISLALKMLNIKV